MQPLYKPASSFLSPPDQVSSSLPELNRFLGGGLNWGSLYEWGVPLGQGGYGVVLSFLNHANLVSANHYALWMHPHPDLQIYAPAWAAHGMPLEHVRFACSTNPLK